MLYILLYFTYMQRKNTLYIFFFGIFRHDGCLLPFVKYIESIPVIWVGNPDEELYAFECTGVALPLHNGGFLSRLSTSFSGKTISSAAKNNYVAPTLRLATKYLPDVNIDLENLYSNIRLVLWGADTVLRSNFASLTQLFVEVRKLCIKLLVIISFYLKVFKS